MKIIDRTPYISQNGELSFVNQILVTLKYGYSWLPEINAQKIVMDMLGRNLTKGYTLMRNITLPRSEAIIPFILVGPAGVFVIVSTQLKGNYQAQNDSWGVVEGGRVRETRSNLLVRTSRMARAIQRYLNKQGFEIANVDGILVATDPGMHIESIRPIVRVVMSDAIEHFVITINHSSSTLDPNMSQTIVNMLTDPQFTQNPTPSAVVESAQPEEQESQADETSDQDAELNELLPWSGDNLGFKFNEETAQISEKPFSFEPEPLRESIPAQLAGQPSTNKYFFDLKQWILLISFGVVEIIILLVFFRMILNNL